MQVLERVWPQNVDKWRKMFPGTRRTGKEPNHLGTNLEGEYNCLCGKTMNIEASQTLELTPWKYIILTK